MEPVANLMGKTRLEIFEKIKEVSEMVQDVQGDVEIIGGEIKRQIQ